MSELSDYMAKYPLIPGPLQELKGELTRRPPVVVHQVLNAYDAENTLVASVYYTAFPEGIKPSLVLLEDMLFRFRHSEDLQALTAFRLEYSMQTGQPKDIRL